MKTRTELICEILESSIEDVKSLPSWPMKIQVDMIIVDLYQAMRKLSEMAEAGERS